MYQKFVCVTLWMDIHSTCGSNLVFLAAVVNSALNTLLAFGFGKPYGQQIWPEADWIQFTESW